MSPYLWKIGLLATLLKTHKIDCSKIGLKKLPWPSQSPDMSPIEHLWAVLERKILMKNQTPTLKADLLGLLHETLQAISQDTICDLIKSMPNRVLADIIQMHSLMIVITCVVVCLYLTLSVEVCIITSANYMII